MHSPVHEDIRTANSNSQNPLKVPKSRKPWTLKHYYLVHMGGFVIDTDPADPAAKTSINAWQIRELFEDGKVAMPTLEDEDIDDRSKASWFTKGIALTQASWFLLQLLARAIDRLPVTTLELYTLGIVLCGIVTYSANWNKPFDVQRPEVLQVLDTELEQWPRYGGPPSYADSSEPLSEDKWLKIIAICAIFAGSHLLGWNFYFSTAVELWLWRVCSICCFVLPVGLSVFLMGHGDTITNIGVVWYILVRLALFVEMFVALRSMPAGVYRTPRWSNYIPSFG
jgi:hypothetical protein